MKVRDLTGQISTWKLTGCIVTANDDRRRSQLHISARNLLYQLFPTSPILEEVPVSILPLSTHYFDFYINKNKLAVEVHGQQHYSFNTFFHNTIHDFVKQKKADENKREWCIINNITYIELPYNESIDQWEARLMNR